MKVIDFFCGAGGFSEGFRQQGYDVIMGVDNWRPAVLTHNLNHNLEDEVMDVLDFEESVENIEKLPDTEIIIGSPPCVSFSMSNNAGKADKSLGIRLIESYLRFVAVKKHKKGSILRAWLMENVPNSQNFVREEYTFSDLNLDIWAKENGINPSDVALKVKNNGDILTASDYGSPQKRQRFVCGEIVATGLFPFPKVTHKENPIILGDVLSKMPKPNTKDLSVKIKDPNYPGLEMKAIELADQFYDTGVYEVEWRESRFNKVNHPFMGRMSFPEALDRPSRTIMATRSASTREALIYKSETGRKGDGEFRLPTIREAATLMGFPYTYQFLGSEGTKWRLIGNAVCPHLSFALAGQISNELGLKDVKPEEISFDSQRLDYKKTDNLNDGFIEKSFIKPPKRKIGAKFRRHPIKAGNITVSLANYHPEIPAKGFGNDWYGLVFIGSGKTYKIEIVDTKKIILAEKILKDAQLGNFINVFEAKFASRLQTAKNLQASCEDNIATDPLNPTNLIDDLAGLINNQDKNDELVPTEGLIQKDSIPLSQVMSIFSIGRIAEATKSKK